MGLVFDASVHVEMHLRELAAVLCASAFAQGCSQRIDFRNGSEVPTVTVNYNGVRAGIHRFPAYGVVDRSILEEKR